MIVYNTNTISKSKKMKMKMAKLSLFSVKESISNNNGVIISSYEYIRHDIAVFRTFYFIFGRSSENQKMWIRRSMKLRVIWKDKIVGCQWKTVFKNYEVWWILSTWGCYILLNFLRRSFAVSSSMEAIAMQIRLSRGRLYISLLSLETNCWVIFLRRTKKQL